MNEKTAKIVNRYTGRFDLNAREVKRQWYRLNAKGRAAMRRKMRHELMRAENDAAVA